MIDATLVINDGDILAVATRFPVQPRPGDRVGFWHERQHVFARVTASFFDQQSDGSFALIIAAKIKFDEVSSEESEG